MDTQYLITIKIRTNLSLEQSSSSTGSTAHCGPWPPAPTASKHDETGSGFTYLGCSVHNASYFFNENYNRCRQHNNKLNRARFQLLAIIFPHIHHHSLCTFASDEQEPVCHARKSVRQQKQATFLQLQ
jgi:hypothetical protein